jgi:hypothetical protein
MLVAAYYFRIVRLTNLFIPIQETYSPGQLRFQCLPSKDGEMFWSIGVLECCGKSKPEFQYELVFIITPLLHCSTTPGENVQ